VIRSDAGDAHRLSLSARVLSTTATQVKAKATAAEALLTSVKTMAKASIWVLWMLTAIEARLNADVESRPRLKPASQGPESADWWA
jgi:hypothetical protein